MKAIVVFISFYQTGAYLKQSLPDNNEIEINRDYNTCRHANRFANCLTRSIPANTLNTDLVNPTLRKELKNSLNIQYFVNCELDNDNSYILNFLGSAIGQIFD